MDRADNILYQIYARRRTDLEHSRARIPLKEMMMRAKDSEPPRGFAGALRKNDRLSIIAEIKFRSPSEGLLRNGHGVEEIARQYGEAGADALSVLTEPNYFSGDLKYIEASKCASHLPVLRKDFIFDVYHIYESRAAGADAVLLIAAMLEPKQLRDLSKLSAELGMDVLLELHDESDLRKADGAHAALWGVNHRNLHTLQIDLDSSRRLMPLLPTDCVKVAESGIERPEQVQLMRERGANAVLIGTSLMRAASPGEALKKLREAACG